MKRYSVPILVVLTQAMLVIRKILAAKEQRSLALTSDLPKKGGKGGACSASYSV